jgi:hypothetical protein
MYHALSNMQYNLLKYYMNLTYINLIILCILTILQYMNEWKFIKFNPKLK